MVSCLMAASLTVAGTTATAEILTTSCVVQHTNVNGYDAGNKNVFGNKGYIYVNTAATIDGLTSWIARSFFVYRNKRNWVEVGWIAIPGMQYSSPTVYADWMNRGTFSKVQFYTGYTLNENGDYRFREENVGDQDIWRFVVDGQSSPFNYSPTMDFNYGTALTNSEHNENCDSLYTDMYDLSDATSPSYWAPWANPTCWNDTATGWYLHEISDTEVDVTQTSGGLC
jgi:hypothetical protein